jgi:hypothetical protein
VHELLRRAILRWGRARRKNRGRDGSLPPSGASAAYKLHEEAEAKEIDGGGAADLVAAALQWRRSGARYGSSEGGRAGGKAGSSVLI